MFRVVATAYGLGMDDHVTLLPGRFATQGEADAVAKRKQADSKDWAEVELGYYTYAYEVIDEQDPRYNDLMEVDNG